MLVTSGEKNSILVVLYRVAPTPFLILHKVPQINFNMDEASIFQSVEVSQLKSLSVENEIN